ncbi:uncharacterized protein LOC143367595 isoform X3 [Andrena cerasifolii]|uniref:uncharacterized protein LOC143367595 isoform X3 n=1 Tax=Andrena cerasifolii TaxID=2819439 RepID=UPI004037D6EF
MRNNEGLALRLLLILVLCAEAYTAGARHLIKKRNYSDQSVRGYLAERFLFIANLLVERSLQRRVSQ